MTHAPIGLFPFAVLGAGLLILASIIGARAPGLGPWLANAPLVADATLVLLALSVGLSVFTFASGLWDWRRRYRGRPYRQITLKIMFSALFLLFGGIAIALHASGAVFQASTGLVDVASPMAIGLAMVELTALLLAMVVIATLGHIGGTLLFGR